MNIAHLPHNLRILNEANCLNAFIIRNFDWTFTSLITQEDSTDTLLSTMKIYTYLNFFLRVSFHP